MTSHTVESRVGLYHKTLVGVIDIPPTVTNKDDYARRNLNITTINLLEINECELAPSTYFPRMARPMMIRDSYIGMPGHGPLYINAENMAGTLPHDRIALANSVNQLAIMIRDLRSIMDYIHPNNQNLECYGHHTRSVLVLAAMDFENECKGLLRAHNYNVANDRFTTNDYVKVAAPLRLEDYEITLSHYPSLPPIKPFDGWDRSNPTLSLPWYHAYNKCKHDREAHFDQATLKNAIHAVCGVAVMLTAQYRIIKSWRDQIGEFFNFDKHPNWNAWEHVVPSRANWQPLVFPY